MLCRTRADPGDVRAGELSLPLSGCSTQDSRPYTSPGQHIRADPDGGPQVSQPEGVNIGELTPQLTCLAPVWATERCLPPPLPPCYLWQVGKLALESREQENIPCPSPAAALQRAGSAPPLGSTVDLALDVEVVGKPALRYEHRRDGPASCPLGGGEDKGEIPPIFSQPSPSMAARRSGPKVMRAPSLTHCNTLESRPCTSAW